VIVVNYLVWLLYGQRLTDEATCYKAFRTDLLRRFGIDSARFEVCAELTAKTCRLGIRIVEVPISYRPRTVAEGKKIGWRDAWRTCWALLKWRIMPLPHPPLLGPDKEFLDRRAVSPAGSSRSESGKVW
jgi:hypothetical protein